MTLDEHVVALCKEHEVRRIVKPGRGRCRARARVIRHPPIVEEMNYFVALHEIGHAVLGLPPGLCRLEREAWCWRWALEHAAYAPHFSTRQRISACLVRYLYRAASRGWKIPTAESDFWKLLAWWDQATA